MKIYFCGSTSVGKSTLATQVAKKYNLPLIPEIARTILVEKDLKLMQLRTDLTAVSEFQEEILKRQIAQEKNFDKFVSDRSLDCLAYSCQFTQTFSELYSSKLCQEYIEQLKSNNVLIFFLRPHLDLLTEDGIREKPVWEGVKEIDGMIKFLLKLNNLRYFQINSINQQERMDLVDAVISLAKS